MSGMNDVVNARGALTSKFLDSFMPAGPVASSGPQGIGGVASSAAMVNGRKPEDPGKPPVSEVKTLAQIAPLPPNPMAQPQAQAPKQLARGGPPAPMGALSQVAMQEPSRYVAGQGDGRDDKIPALLSDGEYVIDAETVAMLGNGSSKAGADALDTFRQNIRSHKGKALAKGKFSPDAKPVVKYLGAR